MDVILGGKNDPYRTLKLENDMTERYPKYCLFEIRGTFGNGRVAFSDLIQAVEWSEVTYALTARLAEFAEPWRQDPKLKIEILLVRT